MGTATVQGQAAQLDFDRSAVVDGDTDTGRSRRVHDDRARVDERVTGDTTNIHVHDFDETVVGQRGAIREVETEGGLRQLVGWVQRVIDQAVIVQRLAVGGADLKDAARRYRRRATTTDGVFGPVERAVHGDVAATAVQTRYPEIVECRRSVEIQGARSGDFQRARGCRRGSRGDQRARRDAHRAGIAAETTVAQRVRTATENQKAGAAGVELAADVGTATVQGQAALLDVDRTAVLDGNADTGRVRRVHDDRAGVDEGVTGDAGNIDVDNFDEPVIGKRGTISEIESERRLRPLVGELERIVDKAVVVQRLAVGCAYLHGGTGRYRGCASAAKRAGVPGNLAVDRHVAGADQVTADVEHAINRRIAGQGQGIAGIEIEGAARGQRQRVGAGIVGYVDRERGADDGFVQQGRNAQIPVCSGVPERITATTGPGNGLRETKQQRQVGRVVGRQHRFGRYREEGERIAAATAEGDRYESIAIGHGIAVDGAQQHRALQIDVTSDRETVVIRARDRRAANGANIDLDNTGRNDVARDVKDAGITEGTRLDLAGAGKTGGEPGVDGAVTEQLAGGFLRAAEFEYTRCIHLEQASVCRGCGRDDQPTVIDTQATIVTERAVQRGRGGVALQQRGTETIDDRQRRAESTVDFH